MGDKKSVSIPYTDVAAFINRRRELEQLRAFVASQPKSLLFLFGPKSSGKTTLIYRFLDELQQSQLPKYEVKCFNLREMLIAQYDDFLKAFFCIDWSQEEGAEVEQRRAMEFNLRVFTLSRETLTKLTRKQLDPFAVMIKELQKLNAQGIRPIIVIDELQSLADIYMNGQRLLLKELFNFFVAVTKQLHLCHVILASSDGCFISRIYGDSKLRKTSHFFEVDYLTRDDTLSWLSHLKEESGITAYTLTELQREKTWDALGGSCWEVSEFLSALVGHAKNGQVADEPFHAELAKRHSEAQSYYENYIRHPRHKQLFAEIHRMIVQTPQFKATALAARLQRSYTLAELKKELAVLVHENFLAYNPVRATYAVQGRSMEIGLAMFAGTISKTKQA